MIYDLEWNNMSLQVLAQREIQQICLDTSEIILTHLKDVLFKDIPRGQTQATIFLTTIQKYLDLMGEALNLQHAPTPTIKVLRSRMFYMTSTETLVQEHMDMTDGDLQTIGPYGLLDILMRVIVVTSRCLGNAIMTSSPDNIIMVEQCLKNSREMTKLLIKTVDRVFRNRMFFIDPNLVLIRVFLRFELTR